LVLTKHLSKSFLQRIVDKEFKDGDKFEVRMETVYRDTSEFIGMDGSPNGDDSYHKSPKLREDGTVFIRPHVDVQAIFRESHEKVHQQFKTQMLRKREEFHERVHAAFVLNTSLNVWGSLTEHQRDWLAGTYPNTDIKTGSDQGAHYTTVTPRFHE
jgi:hypothetical protein